MAHEEDIKKELSERFASMSEKIVIARERRIFAEVPLAGFKGAFDYAVKKMGFSILCTITGQDEGENFTATYHLSRKDGTVLNLKTGAPKTKPVIGSVTSYFPAATCYEKELVDLLGMTVEGVPGGNRYPLPENWPAGQYPLRKDWKPEMLDQIKVPEGE
jgi:membrane-bound hydrogenase subunit beta